MAYWLFKTEPDKFSLNDLEKAPDQTTSWDGIRNYQARNFLRDDVRNGDKVLIYHSRCQPPGIVGVATVVKEAYPDCSAWDPQSEYFDSNASPEYPRWVMVDVQFLEAFEQALPLGEIKTTPELDGMLVAKKGQRLSIMPVLPAHFDYVLSKTWMKD